MPDGVVVREAVATDEGFIKEMLYLAANAPGRPWPSFSESMAEPRNQRFWRGFGASSDLGVVAERSDRPIGAAWIRHLGAQSSSVDEDVRTLAIGVVEHERGRGVGQVLLDALVVSANRARLTAIDLTVGGSNRAAMRLYSSRGFVVVADSGNSVQMRLEIR